ncbi:helix-turn-helix transcriptional regulator [Murinocardiopsis flavida]|nr:helix-turn-helix transcriptional regulator [Murinocardiopsis flavida]
MGDRDSSPVFAGRRRELAALLDSGHQARNDGATAVLLAGEAGVGKSRLLREYAARSPMARVVTGGCLEMGGDGVPFAPFITVLRRLVRDVPAAELGAVRRNELPRLLPELGPLPEQPDEGRARLFEEILTLLEAAADKGGLAVILEDLHWADPSTRALLVFLLHNLHEPGVQLLGGLRTDDLHRTHPMRALLPELVRLPSVTRIDLAALNPAEVAEQAAGIRGTALDPQALARVYERTGGNPLFVESLLEFTGPDTTGFDRAPVPDIPREMLLGRLRGLDSAARRTVRLAAVGGEYTADALLAAASELDEDALDTALRAAVDANLLRPQGEGYAFRHALLAEAIHEDLLPGERIRLHRRYADALQAGVPGLPAAESAAQYAHHAYAGRDAPRALAAAWIAADAAAGALAYPEWLRMLERVLELWEEVEDPVAHLLPTKGRTPLTDRVDVLYTASIAAVEAGVPRRGAAFADAALEELGWAGDPRPEDTADAVRVALLLMARGDAYRESAHGSSLADLRAAQRLLPADHPERPRLLGTLAAGLMMHDQKAESLAVGEEALAAARGARQRRSEADALITIGTVVGARHDPEAGLRTLDEGLGIARAIGAAREELRAIINKGSVLLAAGRVDVAIEVTRRGLDRARELGLLRTRGAGVVNAVGCGLLVKGDLSGARSLLLNTPGSDNPMWRGRRLVLCAEIEFYQGALTRLRETVREFHTVLPPDSSAATEVAAMRAFEMRLATAEDRLADAAAIALDALGPRWTAFGGAERDMLIGAAEVCARLRRPGPGPQGDARARLLAEVEAATRGALDRHDPLPGSVGELQHHQVCGLVSENPAEAVEHLRRAEELGRRLGARVELAATLTALVRMTAGTGDAAPRRLREAAALALDTGANLLRREIADLAAAAGIALEQPGPAPAARAPGGITARESEVLRLVAKGSTNREIAEELRISAKTVSVHVSNLLAKLGVTNRNAAAVRARELDLD